MKRMMVVVVLAVVACGKKSDGPPGAAAGSGSAAPRATKRTVEVSAELKPKWDSQQLEISAYADTDEPGDFTVTGLSKPLTFSKDRGERIAIQTIPLADLDAKVTYQLAFESKYEAGKNTFTVVTQAPPKLTYLPATAPSAYVDVEGSYKDAKESIEVRARADHKLVLAVSGAAGTVLTVDGVATTLTDQPAEVAIDVLARLAAAPVGYDTTIDVPLVAEGADHGKLERTLKIKAGSAFSALVAAAPGHKLTFPGEGAHATHAAMLKVGFLGEPKTYADIDRVVLTTVVEKKLPSCKYVPAGVTDPKEFERYTLFRDLVTETREIVDRLTGVTRKQAWTGKAKPCPASLEAGKNEGEGATRFGPPTDVIAAFEQTALK